MHALHTPPRDGPRRLRRCRSAGYRLIVLIGALLLSFSLSAQEYGKPDRGQPGDRMIQDYLGGLADKAPRRFLEGVRSAEDWRRMRPRYKEEYLYMLGLWPLPAKTPLKATVTGEISGDGFVVEKLHYQSRPGLYVTGNLYRPETISPGSRLPAILYVCGHSGRGRNGNKTAFQSHGMWFARHGYVCLAIDTLQLGEIAATHHGTYRYQRWWWWSRGYTPAGVECWNGVRGIDYLVSRPDVDPERIAVTGISGGGAATFWIAAADERVKAAAPVSGMADLPSYVTNRVINGHCDCMFLYNTFEWPWTRIAALVAPRPLLFVNSDQDAIFPMDANNRIAIRLERLYSLFGAGDHVDSVVSVGGHAYREDLRGAIYRFINIHLKNDPGPVNDSEVDLVSGRAAKHPIAPETLRVFPHDDDIPNRELNTTIDEHFVPMAKVALPERGSFAVWKNRLLTEMKRVSFRDLPWSAATAPAPSSKVLAQRLGTEAGITVGLRTLLPKSGPGAPGSKKRPRERETSLLIVANLEEREETAERLARITGGGRAYLLSPRGTGESLWTRKDPPNFVARSHVLLGRTVARGRVRDVAATAAYLKATHGHPVQVFGEGAAGVIAAYAALFEPAIEEVTVVRPPASHMDSSAPQILNVLRICDIPDSLGCLAPKKLTLKAAPKDVAERVRVIYAAAGAPERLIVE